MANIVEYKTHDVLTAARSRIRFVFNNFKRVVVSVSSGKDSTVLYHLGLQEAIDRKRQIEVFFLDQEAEYESTVQLMRTMMIHDSVIPKWFQVPILMTNACSHSQVFLDAWHKDKDWIHPLQDIGIHEIKAKYPNRFHKFFQWYESQTNEPTAFLIGLRSKESLTRFRSVTNSAGFLGTTWSTKTKKTDVFRFYPLYDWTFGDIWKFISETGVPYNHVYDQYFWKYGINMSNMRISNLVHEKSFKALVDLQEFEPQTYERIVKRLEGVHCAALYAQDDFVYSVKRLPYRFQSWFEFRNYLLASTPIAKRERFNMRFAKQAQEEDTYRDQCKQILLNDWENNIPVKNRKKTDLRARWWDKL